MTECDTCESKLKSHTDKDLGICYSCRQESEDND